MDREDALDAFLAIANMVRPTHPDGDVYPLTRDDINYGVTRSYCARCGPSKWVGKRVTYKTRLTYIHKCSRERHLALLVHEVTHIMVGRHSEKQHGAHPRRFWEVMAIHALEVRDALQSGELSQVFPDVDINEFLDEVIRDPNVSTVDRRYWSVEECRTYIEKVLGVN